MTVRCFPASNPSSELSPSYSLSSQSLVARGGEMTERFLINFMEHQVSRIEVSFLNCFP